ncbi:hypothetical protein, partial [Pengzhenrongella sp.]|uniref:hypothetical protein n=1 Tax=Pengzhenrongella sp. TaxID=2888820 RepID=UPI002F942A93
AEPLRLPWLRDAGTAPLLGSVLMFFSVVDASSVVAVGTLSGMCALLAGASLAGARRAPRSPWIRPGAELGALAAAVAIGTGLDSMANGMLLFPGTAAAAVWLAATGVAYRQVWMQLLSPVAACLSWMVFVANAVDGGPEWYTIAIGLALLVIVSLWRRDQRAVGGDQASSRIVALEVVGVAFLVGASFVEALTVSITHALGATALGVGVAGWGALTRVRRRVVLGALVVLSAMVVLVVVPLVALLPAWSGAGLWLLVAAVGLVAVLAATLLEKGRAAVRSTRHRLRDVTDGWE